MLAGCAHQRLERGRAALVDGRFDEAEQVLAPLASGDSPESDEARSLLGRVRSERQSAGQLLVHRAKLLLEDPAHSRREAQSLLQLALELLQPDSPDAKEARARLEEVSGWLHERELEYARGLAALAKVEEGCVPDVQSSTLARLGKLRRELDGSEDLAATAAIAADRCFAQGRDLDGIALMELAAELSKPGETLPAGASLRLAAAYARLPAWQGRARAPAGRRPPAGARTGASSAGGPAADPVTSGAEQVLARARELYSRGRVFDALTLLDGAVPGANSQLAEQIRVQQLAWQPSRANLVREYLERGEEALARQDPETAWSWYSSVLTLMPGNDIAVDRMQKIQTLRRLRSTSGT